MGVGVEGIKRVSSEDVTGRPPLFTTPVVSPSMHTKQFLSSDPK